MAEEQIVKTEAAVGPEEKKTTEKNAEKTEAAPKAKAKKKRVVRHVPSGRAYVQATYNNTIVTLTDPNGNVLSWSSSGLCGFKGPKKATPYAAGLVVKDAAEKAVDYGLQEVNVLVKGVGSGREAAVRALNANGLNVLSIKDMTPIPHNGCRAPKPRRV
ncbi:MAG: 30S ribosomal protein S11 [Patescibacteria group bacterium]|jgi:small subunit ribosomal protein S11